MKMNETYYAQVYEKAADLIEHYGYWNGQGHRGNTLCAVIAISHAAPTTTNVNSIFRTDYFPILSYLQKYLSLRNNDKWMHPIAQWSDRSGKEVVVSTLRAAAVVCRAKAKAAPVEVAEGVAA